MCNVKSITECPKKVFITTINNGVFTSAWFTTDEESDQNLVQIATTMIMKENNLKKEDIFATAINNKKEPDTIYISKHAQERLRERNGWNLKTSLRMIKKVYDNGVRNDDNKGEAKKYIKKMRQEESRQDIDYITYGQNIYIFREQMLVTVFPIPKTIKR